MVYTDGIHLVADSLDELHEFADKIGLKREWFQDHPSHPHYDIFGAKVRLSLESGALRVGMRDIAKLATLQTQTEEDMKKKPEKTIEKIEAGYVRCVPRYHREEKTVDPEREKSYAAWVEKMRDQLRGITSVIDLTTVSKKKVAAFVEAIGNPKCEITVLRKSTRITIKPTDI